MGSDRAVTDSFNNLHLVPTGKWHTNRMAGKTLHEHTEPGQEEFQEPKPVLLVPGRALHGCHLPECREIIGHMFPHRRERTQPGSAPGRYRDKFPFYSLTLLHRGSLIISSGGMVRPLQPRCRGKPPVLSSRFMSTLPLLVLCPVAYECADICRQKTV
jgi:hypothetical protein